MQTIVNCVCSVKNYSTTPGEILARASRECACGGRLKGHGRRFRWIISLEGVFRVPIQRMVCRACGGTVSLLPQIFYPFFQCARDLTERIRSLWHKGFHAMSDVRHMIMAERPGLKLALSSMYRWASLPSA